MRKERIKALVLTIIAVLLIITGIIFIVYHALNGNYLNYKYIGEESNNYIAVSDGENVGYINTNGKEIISLKYPITTSMMIDEEIDLSMFSAYNNLFPYTDSNDKVGIVDNNENVILEASFDYINIINDNLLIVLEDGDYYLADINGNNILNTTYNDISTIDDVPSYYIVYTNDGAGLINEAGDVLLEPIYDNLTVTKDSSSSNFLVFCTIDNTKEIYLYTNSLSKIDSLSNMDFMYYESGIIYLTDTTNTFYMYEVSTGNLRTLTNSYTYMNPFYNGLALVMNADNKIGYIDEFENLVVDYQYDYEGTTDFNNNALAVVNLDGLKGVVNTSFEEVIPLEYVSIEIIDDNHFIVLDDESDAYIIDANSNKITENVYSSILTTDYDNIYLVSKEENNTTLYGIIDEEGNEIIPVDYLDIQIYDNCYVLKKAENKYLVQKR